MKTRYSKLLNVTAIFVLLWLAVFWSNAATGGGFLGIYDNDVTPSGRGRDTIPIIIRNLDPDGNPTILGNNDSIFVLYCCFS